MLHWGKQNIMLFILNSPKQVAHMSIHLHGFSMQQVLNMKLATWSLLRKRVARPFEKKMQLSDHLNGPELLEIVMLTLELDGNTTMNAASPMVDILLRRHLFQTYLILNLVMMKIL